MTRDLNVLHELALNVSGKADENTSYKGTLVFGNTFSRLGSYSTRNSNTPFSASPANPDNSFGVQIYELAVTFNSKLAGQGLSATIGRVNAQVGKYLFKRSDFTPYYSNERWDNGNYIWDGAIVGFNAGGASFTLVGGTNSIRAFRSRALGPGTYRDTTNLSFLPDQSGDIKLELNTELRAKLFSIVHGAIFIDAGNIWLYNADSLRPGAEFRSSRFMKEIAVGAALFAGN